MTAAQGTQIALPDTALAIGIDVGGTKIAAGLVDETGTILEARRIATPPEGGGMVLDAIVTLAVDVIGAVAETFPHRLLSGIGIGTAGVVVGGRVVNANTLIPRWTGTDVAGPIRAATGLPAHVMNDVHALAYHEASFGHARSYANALVVAVGTGIGGALIIDHTVREGPNGVAGSIGHIPAPAGEGRRCPCGAIDHIEPYASGPALEARFEELTGHRADLRTIAGLARDKDPVARCVIEDGGVLLGKVVAGALNLVDSEIVVVGGGVAQIGEPFLEAIRRGVGEGAMPGVAGTPIVGSRAGADGAMIGAALAALERSAGSRTVSSLGRT